MALEPNLSLQVFVNAQALGSATAMNYVPNQIILTVLREECNEFAGYPPYPVIALGQHSFFQKKCRCGG